MSALDKIWLRLLKLFLLCSYNAAKLKEWFNQMQP